MKVLDVARRGAIRGRTEVIDAVRGRRQIPLSRQITAWRQGFYSGSVQLYDVETTELAAYISDAERAVKLGELNSHRYMFDDKLAFSLYLRALGAPTPEVCAVAQNGTVTRLDEPGVTGGLADVVKAKGRVVVKPRLGSGGRGVAVLTWEEGRVHQHGRPVDDVAAVIGNADHVVTEYAESHPYAKNVFSGAGNSLRLVMLRDGRNGPPFVVAATHRFGTSRSAPVDNWSSGGISVGVDVKTGVMQQAAVRGAGRAVAWVDRHPETRGQIAGVTVPFWGDILAEVRRLAEAMPGVHFAGWDVIVTPQGFTIVEANNRSAVVLQMHGPLLLDERARRFMREYGIRQQV
jgi:hypothetical protein